MFSNSDSYIRKWRHLKPCSTCKESVWYLCAWRSTLRRSLRIDTVFMLTAAAGHWLNSATWQTVYQQHHANPVLYRHITVHIITTMSLFSPTESKIIRFCVKDPHPWHAWKRKIQILFLDDYPKRRAQNGNDWCGYGVGRKRVMMGMQGQWQVLVPVSFYVLLNQQQYI